MKVFREIGVVLPSFGYTQPIGPAKPSPFVHYSYAKMGFEPGVVHEVLREELIKFASDRNINITECRGKLGTVYGSYWTVVMSDSTAQPIVVQILEDCIAIHRCTSVKFHDPVSESDIRVDVDLREGVHIPFADPKMLDKVYQYIINPLLLPWGAERREYW